MGIPMKPPILNAMGVFLLIATVLVSAIAVIYAQHENRRSFVELQILQKHRDEMVVYWGQLQLEQGAWATHGRVEQLARTKLGMVTPDSKSLVLIKP